MSHARRHLKNISALLFSGAVSKLIYFAVTVVIVKELTVSDNDVFQLAFSIAFIVSVFAELGIRGYLVREVARVRSDRAAAQAIFSHVIWARWALLAVVLPVACVVLFLSGYRSTVIVSSLGLIAYALLDSYAILFKFALRAYERMEFDALFSVAGRFLILIWIGLAWWTGHLDLGSIVAGHVVASLLECAGLAIAVRKITGLRFACSFDMAGVKRAAMASIPFAVINLVGVLYLRTGVLVLSKLGSESAVAYFGTPGRLAEALGFLPIAVVNALIPFLSRRSADMATVRRYSDLLMRYLGFAGIFVACVMIFETQAIILAVSKREYLGAIAVFRWYGVWTLASFLQYALANILICLDEERMVMWRYIGALLLNIVLNLALIPHYDTNGAAVALTVSEVASLLFNVFLLYRCNVRFPAQTYLQLVLFTIVVASTLLLAQTMPTYARLALVMVVSGGFVAITALVRDKATIRSILQRGRA